MHYLSKFRGQSAALPPRPSFKDLLFVWLGVFIAGSMIGFLAWYSGYPLLMGSFGASCFILFLLPESPFAQPRNVIGGHFVATLTGLLFLHFVGPQWWSMALALASAVCLMPLLKLSHPPAGSNPIIVFLASAPWNFLLMPTLIGAIMLVIIALFYNNLSAKRHYPTYWW